MALKEGGTDHLIDEDKLIAHSQKRIYFTLYSILHTIGNIQSPPDGV